MFSTEFLSSSAVYNLCFDKLSILFFIDCCYGGVDGSLQGYWQQGLMFPIWDEIAAL